MTRPALRPIADIIQEIDSLRQSLSPVIRRVRVAATTAAGVLAEQAALYQELAGLRSGEQAFHRLVDEACVACFPLMLTKAQRNVLDTVIAQEPADENPAQTEITRELIAAGYIRRVAGSRRLLVATDTGKAAQHGIAWAKL
jgi:hypothetical protein